MRVLKTCLRLSSKRPQVSEFAKPRASLPSQHFSAAEGVCAGFSFDGCRVRYKLGVIRRYLFESRLFMRAFPRHIFPIVGSFLFVAAPLSAQEAPVAAPVAPQDPVAQSSTTTWTTFKGDPQRTGASNANVRLPLSLQWRYSSDAPSRSYTTSPLVIGAPGRQLVIFGAGPNVYALDPQTGAQTWRSPNFTSAVVTPPTLVSGENGDLILVAQQAGRLAALRTSDGGRVWETDALSSITAAGPVIVETPKGRRIVVAVNAGRLLAYNFDGTLDPDWQVALGRFNITPTSSMTLSRDGKLLFICGSDAKLYCVDVQLGAVAYVIQLAANSSVTPVIAGDQLIASNVRRVSGYKASGGASLWNFDPRGEVIGSPAIGTDAGGKKVVYFGTRNGLFYALDDTGGQMWKTEVGAGITGTPLVLPSMVVVGTSNGLLLGFEPSNGKLIWQYRLKTERVPARTQNTGGRGGGRGGGGRGGPGGTTTNSNQPRIWPISSAPTAVDNQLYVLGDNAALYSFSMLGFDAMPPSVVEPSLAVPDDQNKIAALLLSAENPQIVPGRGPIYFAAQLDDTGSGVNPESIKVTLDDVALPAAAVDFQASSGVLTATLLDPEKGGTGFPDGLKNLTVTAVDYAGNRLQYTISFLIDNTAPAPSAARQNRGFDPNNPDGTFPGGGFPGGGFPGAIPDGDPDGVPGGGDDDPDGGGFGGGGFPGGGFGGGGFGGGGFGGGFGPGER
ncbi:hypothetical protein EON80_08700 [bacterium]|nr:MAG: hypothetical protein EON80_08700 [bacterium]